MYKFGFLSILIVLGISLISCGGDTGNEEDTVNISEKNINDYVNCNISNSFSYSNGNCKWNITASFYSKLSDVISANRILYGIAYGVLADLGEDFSERSLYSDSAMALMEKMGVDALGEKYESGSAGKEFSIIKTSDTSGKKLDSEEIDLLKAIKPYAVVVAFVVIDGNRYEITRSPKSINIK